MEEGITVREEYLDEILDETLDDPFDDEESFGESLEDSIEEEPKITVFHNRALQFIVRLLTALAFLTLTAYQTVLLFTTDAAKFGRMLGIISFLLITIASFLTLANNEKALKLCSVMLVVGLFMLFAIKLLNVPGLFSYLSLSNPSSVLNCVVFVLAEVGTVLLAIYYLTLRNDRDTFAKRKAVIVLLSIVIAIYIACLVMECIMLIKYRINIDVSLKVTLATRFVYCFGFVGTAVGLMLPALDPDEEYKRKEGDFIYSEEEDDEFDLVL